MAFLCFALQLTIPVSSWQILDDPSPSPPKHIFSAEFCSFIDACLQKDADARPTAEQVSKRQIPDAVFIDSETLWVFEFSMEFESVL